MNLPTKNIPKAATSTEALLANIANTLAQSQVATKHVAITPSNTDRYTNIKALKGSLTS